jgi:hypothetical protein
MRKRPSPSQEDLRSFQVFCEWRRRTDGIAVPEAEFRNEFAENPDGSVGDCKIPAYVPQAIMAGGGKHDYSQIRVPALAFVGFPGLPQDQIRQNQVTDPEERMVVAAVIARFIYNGIC